MNRKIELKNLFNYVAVFLFFSDGFVIVQYDWIPFDFYYYYVVILIGLSVFVFHYKGSLTKPIVLFFVILSVPSIANIFLNYNRLLFLVKQLTGIIVVTLFYYYLLRYNNFNYQKLLKYYVRVAYVISLIGICQTVSYCIGFKYGYDFSYFIPRWGADHLPSGFVRLHSILDEPAQYTLAMMPALFIGLYNLMNKRNYIISTHKSLVLVVSIVFTFSVTAYLGAIIAGMIVAFGKRKKFMAFVVNVVIVLSLYSIYYSLPYLQMRIIDFYNIVTDENVYMINQSSFNLYNNIVVAINSLKENPLFGSGLGSHPIMFAKHSLTEGPNISSGRYNVLNEVESASLLLRVSVELGLIGILLIFTFIYRHYIPFKQNIMMTEYSIVSNSIFCMFIFKLIKSGHYFNKGLPFFILIYYYNSIRWKAISNDISERYYSKRNAVGVDYR